MSEADKVAAFRAKYPDRAEALERLVAPWIGQNGREVGAFASAGRREAADRVLRVVTGTPEPDPVSRDVPTVRVPQESQT